MAFGVNDPVEKIVEALGQFALSALDVLDVPLG
jgi:hypothetical protein